MRCIAVILALVLASSAQGGASARSNVVFGLSPTASLVAPALDGFTASTPVGFLCTYLQKAQNLVCSIRFAIYVAAMNDDCRARTRYQWMGWQLYRHHRTMPICGPHTLWRGQPPGVTLDVGKTWQHGIFRCVHPSPIALTCRTSTGHGLYVAYGSWRAW
jgi:hypothetical protein